MALIACPDCGKDFSSLAPACPNCGRPGAVTPAGARRVRPALAIGIVLLPLVFAWFTLARGYSVAARLFAFAWLALSALAGVAVWWVGIGPLPPGVVAQARDDRGKHWEELDARIAQHASDPTPDPANPIPAGVLQKAFGDSELAADIQYQGRTVVVSGFVVGTDWTPDGLPSVSISSEKDARSGQVSALFKPYMASNIRTLRQGQYFKAQCTVAGLAAMVVVQGCALLEPAFTFNGKH